MINEFMKETMKTDFPRYKIIQLGATIKEVSTINREVISEKKWFGITIKREYKYNRVVIPFDEFYITYFNRCSGLLQTDRRQMYIAIDEPNKTVYWNYEVLPNK